MSAEAIKARADQRFKFGKNWQRFLRVVDEERIAEAERSLKKMLGVDSLSGRTFLDIGSGSALFSLAAMRLGALKVHSFDYDAHSVACAWELKRRYFPDVPQWSIEQASVLDQAYLARLGTFDIVYAWGVLHHTGDMWRALENTTLLVKDGGLLFIAIYNTQRWTPLMRVVKRTYVAAPPPGKWLMLGLFALYQIGRGLVGDLLFGRNPVRRYTEKKRQRGMSVVHDWVDWLGGYPFETATPDEVFEFHRRRGFRLERLVTAGGGHGNNQFVFSKSPR